jgi:uncharacterized membrane protein YvlD (DUF360 family)
MTPRRFEAAIREHTERIGHDVPRKVNFLGPSVERSPPEAHVIRLLLRTVLALIGNALGLWIASLLLDDMSISGAAFLLAVVIFTVLTVVLQPLVTKVAMQNAPALQGSSALITTFLGLLITELISDGLTIDGAVTWILATVIVWLGAMLAEVVLPMFLFKKQLADDRS